ncbi:hypothetical protein BFP97_02425 [Roseivirga sp. 4D4]|uniref:class II aldolase/adducin family protein n=1 Tax=Roseivirga sp. 4D4 TaxID=1889784 RepID=UPI000852A3E9|nr:class II aldolase/adducin family protein [Roseivirga sp. 4D4]OEK00434.1 hypothetical protein BFP97_02425 [Roseivirga sp. 4D4]
MDDGVIKFSLEWREGEAPNCEGLGDLIHWRDRMYDLGLIGHDHKYDVGFGNISMLSRKDQFIISGTQTGHIPKLGPEYYTEVIDYNIAENRLTCMGPVKASSESLTHAAIYEANAEIRAVIHIHHDQQWESWLNKIPTTDENVPYGTPEMAYEIHRLFNENRSMNVLAMAGHQGGLIAFGKNLEEAARPFLEVFA